MIDIGYVSSAFRLLGEQGRCFSHIIDMVWLYSAPISQWWEGGHFTFSNEDYLSSRPQRKGKGSQYPVVHGTCETNINWWGIGKICTIPGEGEGGRGWIGVAAICLFLSKSGKKVFASVMMDDKDRCLLGQKGFELLNLNICSMRIISWRDITLRCSFSHLIQIKMKGLKFFCFRSKIPKKDNISCFFAFKRILLILRRKRFFLCSYQASL
jgi:hypothetical protein